MLKDKFRARGIPIFYHGALATLAGTFAGHYPWFVTFNFLNAKIPRGQTTLEKLLRSASIGFCASVVSDTTANSIRVVKVRIRSSCV